MALLRAQCWVGTLEDPEEGDGKWVYLNLLP